MRELDAYADRIAGEADRWFNSGNYSFEDFLDDDGSVDQPFRFL